MSGLTIYDELGRAKVTTYGISDLMDWTPTLYQNGSVSCNVTYAKYMIVGDLTFVIAKISVTGSGSAGNDIVVTGLPNTPATADDTAIGSGWVLDNGTAWYAATALYDSANVGIKFVGYNTVGQIGTSPSFALANTDGIGLMAWYEN